MVDGAIAGADHDQPLHAPLNEQIDHRTAGARMAADQFHPGPVRPIQYRTDRIGCPRDTCFRHFRQQVDPSHAALLHETQRPCIAGIEGVEAVRVDLAHRLGAVYHAGTHRQHPPCRRIEGRCHRIQQVLRSIGSKRGGWAHGAGQHDGLARIQQGLQEPGGLFQRIGSMCDDDALHAAVLQPVQAAGRQIAPDGHAHVLAVDLRDLFGHQLPSAQGARQARNRCEQIPNRHLRCRVPDVVTCS